MIKQFLRTENGQPIGVLVADVHNNVIQFGWSVTHPNDNFNKLRGERIAKNRMYSHDGVSNLIIPTKLISTMELFIIRAEKYFNINTSVETLDGYFLSKKTQNKANTE